MNFGAPYCTYNPRDLPQGKGALERQTHQQTNLPTAWCRYGMNFIYARPSTLRPLRRISNKLASKGQEVAEVHLWWLNAPQQLPRIFDCMYMIKTDELALWALSDSGSSCFPCFAPLLFEQPRVKLPLDLGRSQ